MFDFLSRRKNRQPGKKLVVLGTEFGSYQFQQLVEKSSDYQVVGFVSDDSWQRKSSLGEAEVFGSAELASVCAREQVAALILPSDQQDFWLKNSQTGGGSAVEQEESPLAGLESLLKVCDVLSIPSDLNQSQANQFLDRLIAES